jgi:hypothetical protein
MITETVDNPAPNVGDTIRFTITVSDLDGRVDQRHGDRSRAARSRQYPRRPAGGYSFTTGVWTLGTVTTSSPQTLQIQTIV